MSCKKYLFFSNIFLLNLYSTLSTIEHQQQQSKSRQNVHIIALFLPSLSVSLRSGGSAVFTKVWSVQFRLHKMGDFPLFKARVGQQVKMVRHAIKLPHVTQKCFFPFFISWCQVYIIFKCRVHSNINWSKSTTKKVCWGWDSILLTTSPVTACFMFDGQHCLSICSHLFPINPLGVLSPDWPLVIPVTIYLLLDNARPSLVTRSASLWPLIGHDKLLFKLHKLFFGNIAPSHAICLNICCSDRYH